MPVARNDRSRKPSVTFNPQVWDSDTTPLNPDGSELPAKSGPYPENPSGAPVIADGGGGSTSMLLVAGAVVVLVLILAR